MKAMGPKRLLSFLLAVILSLQTLVPAAAFADERSVQVDNHTASREQVQTVSDLKIDGVTAPKPGAQLDDRATVTAAEGASWEIPVLWVRDDLSVVTTAEEGRTYLPVLAFFVPQEYSVRDGAFTVILSDSLARLFGTNEVISVYNEATGITYILPASLKDLFMRARADAAAADSVETRPAAEVGPAADEPAADEPAAEEPAAEEPAAPRSLVDIYCAQSARDAFTDEDLEWLLDLILHRLQPQAIELLINSFPSFRAAADRGELGTQIGMYVYYLKGDDDVQEHCIPEPGILGYVIARGVRNDGQLRYCYMFGMDLDDLTQKDEDGNPVRDPTTGKFKLIRTGKAMTTFENTVVHEFFHAIMDDYNRTGMSGGTSLEDIELDENNVFVHQELASRYSTLVYPKWFREGTASNVENTWTYRYDYFTMFRKQNDGYGALNPTFTAQTIFDTYVNSDARGMYFDIMLSDMYQDSSGRPIDTAPAKYVTGYLATLYLAELSARQIYGKSSVQLTDDSLSIDSAMLRNGLDGILRRMHEGETLDSLIKSLSPKDDNNNPVYTDTNSFAAKFIKGSETGEDRYAGDTMKGGSLEFVNLFLNYMNLIEQQKGVRPNGSILFEFAREYESPLDPNREATSDNYKIVEDNKMVESSVKPDAAEIGGGKSTPPAQVAPEAQAQAQTQTQAQAETPAAEPIAAKESVTEPAGQVEEQPQPAAEQPEPEPQPVVTKTEQPEPVAPKQ